MGQGQSQEKKSLVVSEETMKIEYFSNIFIRLLKSSDIVDIRSLTSGPGACGSYVMLLAKNIEKDFKKIKLQTGATNASAMNDFLYASTKVVLSQSPSDQVACRYLAIFYIRVLQLVAALTMSIYSPPDLISRIRNRVYESSLKLQKRGIRDVLTKNVQTEQRIKRDNWLLNLLLETEKTNIYTLGDKTQLEFNKITNVLTYTSTDKLEYKLRLEVKEPEQYNVSEKMITDSTYWIEVTNNYKTEKERQIVYRALVDGEGGGWLFTVIPDLTAVEEEPFTGHYDDWAMDLEVYILNNNAGVSGTAVKQTNYYGDFGVKRQHLTQRNSKRNGSKMGTKKNASVFTKEKTAQEQLNLGDQTTLPPKYRESYRAMTKWLVEIPSWTEAAPATYRATLLFNKPSLPTTPGSTYSCVDRWANIRLRESPPFAALETLFFDKDDGTASSENVDLLKRLTNEFNKIYQTAPLGEKTAVSSNKPKEIAGFDDVFIPPIGDFLQKSICNRRTAQGEALIEQKYAIVFEKAQVELIKKYKEHLDQCYEILNHLFTTKKVGSDTTIRFSDEFVNSKIGARNELEENIIPTASTLIANHYLDVEKIYYGALSEIVAQK